MVVDRILIVRDDGLGSRNPVFAIGRGEDWRVIELEGYDGLEHDVAVQEFAQYDGGGVVGERASTQDRTLTAAAVGDVGELRDRALSFFASGFEFEVHVEAEGRGRMCRARHYGLRLRTDPYRRVQVMEWTSISPDPYWMSEDAKSFDLAEASPMRGFPFMSLTAPYVPPAAARGRAGLEPGPQSDGICAGFLAGVLRHEIEMVNNGGGTAYPRFVMTASGEVVNPRVSITDASGEVVCRFGVKVTMRAGGVLVVDFSARPTLITYGGKNCSNKVTAGSTLATGIRPGTFTVTWECDSGDAALSIRPSIQERYESI